MQQDRNRSRPYDQNRDTLRSSAPSQRSTPRPTGGDGNNSRYGYNGEPLSRPPARTSNGDVRRSRTDNSIQFPGTVQQRSSPTRARQRSRSGDAQQSSSLRVAGGGAARQNRNKKRRPNAQNVRNDPTAARQNGQRGQNPNRSRTARPNGQNAQQRYRNQRLRPAPEQRDPARREGRKKRKVTRATLRRRRIMRRVMAFAMLLCVIGAGVYLTVTMLFRISSIQVQAADGTQVTEIAGYSADSILQALGVQLEQNIFSFEPGAKEAALERQFPLLESIKVVRDYPSTVVVKATEATPMYAVQDGSSWLIVSDTMKILSSESSLPDGLCTLYGGTVENTAPGEQLAFTEDTGASADSDASAASQAGSEPEAGTTVMDVLTTLRSKLEEYGLLSDVTRMEFADTEQIAFLYQDRISVLLGTVNELDYKLEYARYVLTNADGKGCGPTDTGRLDLSHSSARNNRKSYFAQGEPTLPSGYVVTPRTVDDTVPADGTDAANNAENPDTAAEDAAAEDTAAQPAENAGEEEVPLTDPARMTANNEENPM